MYTHKAKLRYEEPGLECKFSSSCCWLTRLIPRVGIRDPNCCTVVALVGEIFKWKAGVSHLYSSVMFCPPPCPYHKTGHRLGPSANSASSSPARSIAGTVLEGCQLGLVVYPYVSAQRGQQDHT